MNTQMGQIGCPLTDVILTPISGHYDVPLKWVTFGDPGVPTYGYTFGEMALELGLIYYHRPYNWGPNSVFPAILVTRDT